MTAPRIGLVLGAGGALGLAHVAALEAFDVLDIKPTMIAGASMGAIVGAAYAAGLSGLAIREHVLRVTRDRAGVIAKLLQARVGKVTDLFSRGLANPVLLDGERFLDLFWPDAVPDRFEDLAIPLRVMTADYGAQTGYTIDSGALVTAVAASMAIPGLIRPITIDGHILIDGGSVNPLPIDLVAGSVDIVVAIDVTGRAGERGPGGMPSAVEAMLGASLIMQTAIIESRLSVAPPDILLRPDIGSFRALDFFRAPGIFDAAAPMTARLVEALKPLIGRD